MGKVKADLDLRKLEIFYWVAELKSFSQAAEMLSLRQPTVSAHVQELEEATGGQLLYRVRSEIEAFERVVAEADLSPIKNGG